jgi:hypothetical protein
MLKLAWKTLFESFEAQEPWRIEEGVGEDTFEELVFKGLRATRPKAHH